jgi:Pentapeptide repeats (8 copies)
VREACKIEQEGKESGKKRPPLRSRLWAWTGFADKTLWEWLQLLGALAIPVVLAIAGFWFTSQQEARQQRIEDQRAQQAQKIENQRAEAERELAEQRAQDEALQAYLDQMGSLLLERDLRTSEEDSEVRTLARARTLTVLERLDPSRKKALMQFLVEAELVQRVDGREPIISLLGATLSDADLFDANLSGADLSGASLSYTDLSKADLQDSSGVTKEKLKQQAQSLRVAIMPDGTVFSDRYATSEFEPALSFSLSEEWEIGEARERPDSIVISSGLPEGQLSFTSPLHVFDPSDPSKLKELPAPENATEWVSWFQKHPNLGTSKPVPASVGGASGVRIDVTASSTPENYPKDFCDFGGPCVPLYPLSDANGIGRSAVYGIGGSAAYEGFKYRFVIVDVSEGETVIIQVSAPTRTFEEFLPKAQKVLDSVEWKGG